MSISNYESAKLNFPTFHTMYDVDPDHGSCLCCVCDSVVRHNDKAVIVYGMDTQHIAHKKCAESINRY